MCNYYLWGTLKDRVLYKKSTSIARTERQYSRIHSKYFKTRDLSCVKKFVGRCKVCLEAGSWCCQSLL